MLRKSFVFILFLVLYTYNVNSQNAFYPQENKTINKQDKVFLHTVERGQTVYSISKMYNVSVESIYQLNPGSETNIQLGSTLKIPQSKEGVIYHTIEPKETLYSVSKRYNVAGEDIIEVNPGLSIQTFIIGRTIKVPLNKIKPQVASNGEYEEKTNLLLFKTPEINKVKSVKVVLLMPFGTIEKTDPANLKSKVVEYYEGLLLALDSLKKSGIIVNLQVLDIGNGTEHHSRLLEANELKSSHLIIGGISDAQIQILSDFSKQFEIPYVVPFTSKCDNMMENPFIFQINTPSEYLYAKASKAFVNKYRKYNVIILEEEKKDKSAFIKTLKTDLTVENISYKTLNYSDNFAMEIEILTKPDMKNVIVPTSGTKDFLSRISPILVSVSEKSAKKISIFGYPEWQTYASGDIISTMHRLNATFYSNFYVRQLSEELNAFNINFYRWFSRTPANSYPRFSLLGFDTGMFFISAINQLGKDFESNVNRTKYRGIQTDFNFQRVNNWGGFINTNVFFIELNQDLTVNKERK